MVSTRGRVALLVQVRDRFPFSAKLLAPHVATRIWVHVYGPFKYPGEYPSVGCTSHPGVRSVFLIDPGLTFFRQKKRSNDLVVSRLLINVLSSSVFIL